MARRIRPLGIKDRGMGSDHAADHLVRATRARITADGAIGTVGSVETVVGKGGIPVSRAS
jgi:hypothetical protein